MVRSVPAHLQQQSKKLTFRVSKPYANNKEDENFKFGRQKSLTLEHGFRRTLYSTDASKILVRYCRYTRVVLRRSFHNITTL
jgi:hypothetical protein